MLGSGLYIDNAPAVLMREGSGNMCRGGDDNTRGYQSIIRLEQFHDKYYNLTYAPLHAMHQQLKEYVADHFSDAEKEAARPFMEELERNMLTRSLMRDYWRKGIFHRLNCGRAMGYPLAFSMLYSLPMPIYAAILVMLRKLKRKP